MKRVKLAFLYNVRHSYPKADDPRAQLETDFDDPPTIDYMIKHLTNCGYDVLPIEANQKAYFTLFEHKDSIDLAFNYAEGMFGHDREAQFPMILEMLEIPHLGASPLTRAIVYNKARAKDVLLANNVSTLPYQLFITGKEKLNEKIDFPVIVKPVAQGSSAGITNKSVAHSTEELYKQVQLVIDTFKEPALVEPFLTGPEFSVGMLGNPPILFPIIQPDHKLLPAGYEKMDSLEVKWEFEEEVDADKYLLCPAPIDDELKKKIEQLCLDTWQALQIQDWCRIDIRCDEHNKPYILEVNIPAGLIPPEVSTTSYYPLGARKMGIEYDDLLKKLVNTALERYNK